MSEIWIFDVLSENETFFVIFNDYEVSKPDILMALMQKIDKKWLCNRYKRALLALLLNAYAFILEPSCYNIYSAKQHNTAVVKATDEGSKLSFLLQKTLAHDNHQ